MSFAGSAGAYDRFMGRYSQLLAPLFADFAGVRPPQKVLDVGCGPGALTSVLIERLGTGLVTAVDPSEPFAEAVRRKHPGIEVHKASAERLPFEAASFELTLAQLVVHHMADPVAGIRELARVTKPGGVVAACVWDHAGDKSPFTPFWRGVRALDPTSFDGSDFPGSREGELVTIFDTAGLVDVQGDALEFEFEHASFEAWWEPFTLGVGPVGRYVADLDSDSRSRLEDLCRASLPAAPFTLPLRVWTTRGSVPP